MSSRTNCYINELIAGRRRLDKSVRRRQKLWPTRVCRAFGIDSTTRSSDYIQLYRGSEDVLKESLGFVQQTASNIIQLVRSQSEGKTESAAAVLAA